jgi:hypothetical protein
MDCIDCKRGVLEMAPVIAAGREGGAARKANHASVSSIGRDGFHVPD